MSQYERVLWKPSLMWRGNETWTLQRSGTVNGKSSHHSIPGVQHWPLARCSCCDRVTVSYVERWNRIRRSYENPSVMSPAGACNSVAPRYLYCPERTCAVFWLSHPYSAPLSIVLMWLMLSIVDYKLRNISTETAVIRDRSRAGIIALSKLSLLKSRWKTDLEILSDNVLLVK